MNDTRKEGRLSVVLLARYREPTMLEPREGECRDLSMGGMFIMTPRPSPRGALIRFECSAVSTDEIFRGTGRVVWQRNKSDPRGAAGMGIRFVRLEAGSREVLQRIIQRVHDERQRTRSEPGRRTSSGPPPRVRTTEAVTQPVPILSTRGPGEGPLFPRSSTPLISDLHKPTLRGVAVGLDGPPDLGPGLRSPLPPPLPDISSFPTPAQPSELSSTLPLHSARPPEREATLSAAVASSSEPSDSAARSPTVPLSGATWPQSAVQAPSSAALDPVTLRERLDRTRRGVGSSPMPPAWPASNSPAPEFGEEPTAPAVTKNATRPIGDAPYLDAATNRTAADAFAERPSAAFSRATGPERTAAGRVSDRPPRPGGIDDLRSSRASLPPLPEATSGDPANGRSLEGSILPEVSLQSSPRSERAGGPALLVADSNNARRSNAALWVVLGSGLVVSAIVARVLGGSAVGVPKGVTVGPETLPNKIPAPAQHASPSPTPLTQRNPSPSVPPPLAPPTQAVSHPEASHPSAPNTPSHDPTSTPPARPVTSASPESTSAQTRTPMKAAEPPRHHVAAKAQPEAPPAPPSQPAPIAEPEVSSQPAAAAPSSAHPDEGSKLPAKSAEPETHPGPLAQALDCLARGDNRCVIRALEDKAETAREIDLLIATYRTVGSTPRAEKEMKRYIERFPNGPRAAEYQRLLDRRAPSNVATPDPTP